MHVWNYSHCNYKAGRKEIFLELKNATQKLVQDRLWSDVPESLITKDIVQAVEQQVWVAWVLSWRSSAELVTVQVQL